MLVLDIYIKKISPFMKTRESILFFSYFENNEMIKFLSPYTKKFSHRKDYPFLMFLYGKRLG